MGDIGGELAAGEFVLLLIGLVCVCSVLGAAIGLPLRWLLCRRG